MELPYASPIVEEKKRPSTVLDLVVGVDQDLIGSELKLRVDKLGSQENRVSLVGALDELTLGFVKPQADKPRLMGTPNLWAFADV